MTTLTFSLFLVVLYGAVVAASILLTQPLRVRMAAIVDDLLDQPGRTDRERAHLEWLVASSTSSKVGMLLPLASLTCLAAEIMGAKPPRDRDLGRLMKNPAYDLASQFYVGSVMLSSPIASLVSLPLLLACGFVAAARGQGGMRGIEAPVFSAAGQLQPC